MAYNELNTLIDTFINRNGVQAITGQILNGVLKAMVQQLGAGYSIGGVAEPSDDPGTPDAPVAYFASEPGTYTDFDGITIAPGEFALLCYDLNGGWSKSVMYEGFQSVGATVDGNTGTPAVNVTYNNGVLSFAFSNLKGAPGNDGNDGDAAGFGTIGATVDGNVGTPGVTVQESGPNTAKNLQFNFTNLKGETGVTSVVATVDDTVGTPTCTVSLVGQQLTLAFTGLKGAQGDTGSSVDYPFTIVNNLTTNDATQALSAAQGKVLKDELGQLEAEIHNLSGKFYEPVTSSSLLPEGDEKGYTFVGATAPFAIWYFDGTNWSDTGMVVTAIEGKPGQDGVGFDDANTPTVADGTVIITLSDGNTITLDLNHNHEGYYSKVLGGAMPVGGFLPDVVYSLGTLSGTITFSLAAAVTGNVNHYFWMFDTSSTAPTITWPAGITWAAGAAPTVAASKHYEISILGGIAYYSEV